MGRLAGKVAIITGGFRGQGAAETRLFLEEGAVVVSTDVIDEPSPEIIEIAGHDRLRTVRHDVTSETDWATVVHDTLGEFGQVDVLVNNAGIYNPSPITKTSLEAWQRVQSVNVTGVFLGMRAVLPSMQTARKGSIINVSSTAGIAGEIGGAYCASKGAVRNLTKSAVLEGGPYGVRVNSLHPGTIETPMIEALLSDPATREELEREAPLPPHIGQPIDVAYGALYLASDEARWVTGAELVIDGGWLAH